MHAFSIRKANSGDIPMLIALDHGFSTDHVWQMAIERADTQVQITFREVRLPRPMRVAYPREPEALADEWTMHATLLVAEVESVPLGYITIDQGPARDSGWITDLVVGLPSRRQGVASRLLKTAHEWCRDHELGKMFIEMQSKNYPGINLVRKFGFVFAGYSDHYYPDQDIALFFSLDLH